MAKNVDVELFRFGKLLFGRVNSISKRGKEILQKDQYDESGEFYIESDPGTSCMGDSYLDLGDMDDAYFSNDFDTEEEAIKAAEAYRGIINRINSGSTAATTEVTRIV